MISPQVAGHILFQSWPLGQIIVEALNDLKAGTLPQISIVMQWTSVRPQVG